MPSSLSRSLLAGLVSLTLVAPATAAVSLQLTETSTSIVGSFSGSLDLTGLTFSGTNNFFGGSIILPSTGGFASSGTAGIGDSYTGTIPGTPFGTFPFANVVNEVGSTFGFTFSGPPAAFITVPSGTVFPNTGPLSGSFDLGLGSFAGLGITGGTFITTLPSGDTITIIATPVPEPSTYALMLAGLGVLGFMARRQRGKLVGAGE